jgi:hypothetical protein
VLAIGTGLGLHLAPGEHREIPFAAGTDSRDLRLGPILPPGDYHLVVTIPVHTRGDRGRNQLVTPAIPIHVVPRAEP